ncbi:ABC transporter permease [Consotaella salsifontis]|uniref:Transport permease protein n=1 Tax=Consotaella salsifontis TaxID=1365950 RepID=A0A1T4P2Q7_9HYPH|nr:ABC transporter permease [Consotaella salsifontis]SJZ85238.1 lipopolysaccharide transport system permease protein [Consotaella salsifontis]
MFGFLTTAWCNRTLLLRLSRREVEARYKGSFLGIAWAALMPLIMIGIYSFVFGNIMRTRWLTAETGAENSVYSFAMLMFCGFILFGVFSEALARAPGLMLENTSYVKKVVFPLDILPWVVVVSSLINAGIAFLVFLALFVVFYGLPPLTIVLLPLVVIPVTLITLGLTYFLASFGVFLRDLRQFVPMITTALLFLSPVFYPLDAVPAQFKFLISMNPITIGVSEARDVIFWGRVPSPVEWGIYTAAGIVVAALGYAWFARTRKAFADVI